PKTLREQMLTAAYSDHAKSRISHEASAAHRRLKEWIRCRRLMLITLFVVAALRRRYLMSSALTPFETKPSSAWRVRSMTSEKFSSILWPRTSTGTLRSSGIPDGLRYP